MFTDEKRWLFLIVGGFVVLSGLLVAAVLVFDVRSLVQGQLPVVQEAVGDAIDEVVPLRSPPIDDNGEYIITDDEFKLPPTMLHMGLVKRGMAVGGAIGMQRIEGWSIVGAAGDTYLLDFDPLTSGFLWEMGVYGPDEMLLSMTMDSDAGYADFTQLEVTLPTDGTYYVVLSAFGPDGKYGLKIE